MRALSFGTGFAAHYYSWRLVQMALGIVGLLSFFAIVFFFPETYHPGKRGVDKLDRSLQPRWRPVILNPLQPLWLLRSPNLLAVVCGSPFHCLEIGITKIDIGRLRGFSH